MDVLRREKECTPNSQKNDDEDDDDKRHRQQKELSAASFEQAMSFARLVGETAHTTQQISSQVSAVSPAADSPAQFISMEDCMELLRTNIALVKGCDDNLSTMALGPLMEVAIDELKDPNLKNYCKTVHGLAKANYILRNGFGVRQ